MDGLSGDDTRGLELDSLAEIALDGAVAIDGVAEGVDNTTEHALTDGDIDDRTCSLDNITFLDLSKCIKDKYIFRQLPEEVLTYRYQGRQYQHYQFPS